MGRPPARPSKIVPCPMCGHGFGFTRDTRPLKDAIRRRRECMNCHHRFTTYETMDDPKSKNGRTTPEEIIAAAIVEAFGMIQPKDRN